MSLNAIFRYPSLYRTAVAIAFVADMRLYDTIYQERYMGLPSDNEPRGTAGGVRRRSHCARAVRFCGSWRRCAVLHLCAMVCSVMRCDAVHAHGGAFLCAGYGYREGSPLHFAHRLLDPPHNNLLLVYGTADDNCHYQNCEQLVEVRLSDCQAVTLSDHSVSVVPSESN